MAEMDEMRKGLVNIQMKGRIGQGKLESSIASINDLLRQREGQTEMFVRNGSDHVRKGSTSRRAHQALVGIDASWDTNVDKRIDYSSRLNPRDKSCRNANCRST